MCTLPCCSLGSRGRAVVDVGCSGVMSRGDVVLLAVNSTVRWVRMGERKSLCAIAMARMVACLVRDGRCQVSLT